MIICVLSDSVLCYYLPTVSSTETLGVLLYLSTEDHMKVCEKILVNSLSSVY